jgi:hypothetical protein
MLKFRGINMIFDFDDLKFDADAIIINDNFTEICIKLSDIWTLFYAKWSLQNYFSLTCSCPLAMGYLYIATKKMNKISEVIKIKISSKQIENIPKEFYEKIEFYKIGTYPDILRLKRI